MLICFVTLAPLPPTYLLKYASGRGASQASQLKHFWPPQTDRPTFLIGLKILSQLNTGKHNLQGNNSKYGQAARPISTGKLQPLLAFHIRPINLVVYEGSLGGLHPGIPYLGGGFPLICFQRLSCPHIATRRCGWRHNRNTSGASFPVLSY